jgi:predicted O-linked N-acetylglucosamine transferase (SPINDLY family)
MDAQLTQLMARLYDRDPADTAARLAADAKRFSNAHLQLPGPLLTPKARGNVGRFGRPRVGLLSNQFSVSPVYFLTIAGWQHVAKGCDIILFNRGHQRDWASEAFFSLASRVMDVQHLPALELARAIAAEQIDVLYDLGGWMDPIGLQALSLKPARVQYKWVGGQSMTTGLRCFDGWIGDAQQSPLRLQGLYSEPLINVAGGYARYTPPAYLPTAAANKSAIPCIFSNPAKVSRAFLAYLSKLPGKKVFIHRQYRFARPRARIEEALGTHAVEFIYPQSHAEALMALNQHATMLDTFPYSSGLTAYEASALGTRIQCAPQARQGQLFAERHTARFWKVTA